MLPGLVAVGLPAVNVCGVGSTLAGTSVISLTGGSLAAGASCEVPVTVQVPADAAPGTYANVTSPVSSNGVQAGAPAADDLEIEPAPLFSKAFVPASILSSQVSTLVFTIDNTANALAATGLAFTDALPAGVVVATPPAAASTCGGTVTAVAGTGTVALSGGTVAAGASCTVQVDVAGLAAGTFVNTSGELTSSLGSSGPATASLEVTANLVEIPALGGWGLLLLAGALALLGWGRLRTLGG